MRKRLYKSTVVDTSENPELLQNDDVVDDFHLCNIVVVNCCYSFFCLSVLTLIIILVLYLSLVSMWVESIGDPTAAIISYILRTQGLAGVDVSAINTACYLGGIGSCESLTGTAADLERIKPVIN